MRARHLRAQNRFIWSHTWGFEQEGEAAITGKDGVQKCPEYNIRSILSVFTHSKVRTVA